MTTTSTAKVGSYGKTTPLSTDRLLTVMVHRASVRLPHQRPPRLPIHPLRGVIALARIKESGERRWTTGQSIRALRQSLGLSQSDFWTPFGVTQSGASRYEASNRRIPKAVLMLIQIAHGSEPQATAIVKRLRTPAWSDEA